MNLHAITHIPPNTQNFDCIEVSGVKEFFWNEVDDRDGTFCEQVMAHEQADFWSTYGHLPHGGVECIGDYTTKAEALAAAQRMSEDWNIPIEDYT
jgi:hypothetical protein